MFSLSWPSKPARGKVRLIDEELENGSNAIKILGGELQGIIEVSIEETDLKHNIVEVKKVKNCPKTYPRKAGTVNKKPLQ